MAALTDLGYLEDGSWCDHLFLTKAGLVRMVAFSTPSGDGTLVSLIPEGACSIQSTRYRAESTYKRWTWADLEGLISDMLYEVIVRYIDTQRGSYDCRVHRDS